VSRTHQRLREIVALRGGSGVRDEGVAIKEGPPGPGDGRIGCPRCANHGTSRDWGIGESRGAVGTEDGRASARPAGGRRSMATFAGRPVEEDRSECLPASEGVTSTCRTGASVCIGSATRRGSRETMRCTASVGWSAEAWPTGRIQRGVPTGRWRLHLTPPTKFPSRLRPRPGAHLTRGLRWRERDPIGVRRSRLRVAG
jgi:hypothetical protein